MLGSFRQGDSGLRAGFAIFSAEKLAGRGVFGRRMSVQKPSTRKTLRYAAGFLTS